MTETEKRFTVNLVINTLMLSDVSHYSFEWPYRKIGFLDCRTDLLSLKVVNRSLQFMNNYID